MPPAAPNEPAVRIAGVSYDYPDRRAVADLSLEIAAGEIFAILGPNGSGKTTLFRLLTTLVPPQSGTIEIFGRNVATDRNAVRQQIGVVFQSPSLDQQLTADENLRHHGHLYGLAGRVLEAGIKQRLDQFGLLDRRHERVGKFSGGMRRRVELAKALLTGPRLLLLDEPSTGLDPGARIELRNALQQARKATGLTVVFTTHLMEEADPADRLAIFDQGRLVASDTPLNLKSQIGGDVITLQTADPAGLAELLSSKLNASPAKISGAVRIERENGPAFIPALFAAAGELIQSVSLSKPTLEDVFLRATGKAFRDEADTR